MKKALIIDTSVFLTYISFNKVYRITSAIQLHNLEVFVNETLINEIERNINKTLQVDANPLEIINQILTATTLVKIVPSFTQSPDPKDNFLFDLAIQTNSEIIIS